jgi:excisionase family DNA binding protein
MPDPQPRRFLSLDDVAEELSISHSQAYALVRRRDLPAIKVGGRGQWRVERVKFEEYIARLYDETSTWLDSHAFDAGEEPTE